MAPERPGWEASGTKKSRWDTVWLLVLTLKAFGLKEGNSVTPMDLQCLYTHVMNCSWSAPDVNSTYNLVLQSLTLHQGELGKVPVPQGQNWQTIPRKNVTLGDTFRVWLEDRHAAGEKASENLNFLLDDIVKPPAPEMDPVVVSSSGATIRWRNPYWSEDYADQHLVCELQYKGFKDAAWIQLDHINQEDAELEDLEPFTWYTVQSRCILQDGKGYWSEWSSPHTFRSAEAAPLGQVDVWRTVKFLGNSEPTLHLLWKPLDQETARGVILKYTVDFWDCYKSVVGSLACLCYSVPVPAAACYALVSAYNSAGQTQPTTLCLEQTELSGPRDVQVQAAQCLGLNVTWTFNSSPGGARPEQYVVEWRNETSGELLGWIHRPLGSRSALLTGDFRSKEPYLVSVYAVYAQGSNASAPVRAYLEEGVPSAGPPAVQDQTVSSTVSLISWEEIPLASQHGHLTHYTIYLKSSVSGSPKGYEPIAVNATERSHALKGLVPGTTYQLWVSGSTSVGEGRNSSVHEFHTPGARWQVYLAAFLSVGLLFLLAIIVVFLKRGWFLSFYRKVLPVWCWERVPDPGHSLVITKLDSQGVVLAQDISHLSTSTKPPDEPEILKITEPPPPQTVTPVRVVFSDYEKHFLPTREELQRLT